MSSDAMARWAPPALTRASCRRQSSTERAAGGVSHAGVARWQTYVSSASLTELARTSRLARDAPAAAASVARNPGADSRASRTDRVDDASSLLCLFLSKCNVALVLVTFYLVSNLS